MRGRIFVSYARNDLREPELEAFFKALDQAISLELGTKDSELFRDSAAIEHGEDWSESLTEAIGTCPLLLAVGSPSYLASDYCGREFGVFCDRIAAAKAASPDPAAPGPRAIFPVIWRKPETGLPEAFSRFQHDNDEYPEAYRLHGLRRLCRLDRHGDDRKEMIDALAHTLVKALLAPQLAPAARLPPLQQQRNHFRPAPADPAAAPSPSAPHGPSFVRLLIVAGRREELVPIRSLVTTYGIEPWLWTPYAPESEAPIGVELQRIVAQSGLLSEVVQDDDLLARIQEAEARHEIVVLVADPWATKLERLIPRLRPLDHSYSVNCVFLVAWNGRDSETSMRLAELQASLQDIFRKKYLYPPGGHVFVGVNTYLDLRQRLEKEITDARLRIIATATPRRAEHAALAAQAEREGIDVSNRAILSTGAQELP